MADDDSSWRLQHSSAGSFNRQIMVTHYSKMTSLLAADSESLFSNSNRISDGKQSLLLILRNDAIPWKMFLKS